MKSFLMAGALLAVFVATNLQASPAPCPTSGSGPNGAPSYQDLLNTNTNGGCSILDIVFSDFTFLASQTGGAAAVSPSNVVYTVDSNTGSAGLIGFEFALALNASGAQSNDIKLSYNVRTASGAAKIASLHLLQTASTSGGGTATISETYCLGGLNNTGCSQTGTLNTSNTLPHQDLLGLGPDSQLSITEDMNVAGNGAGGSAMISGVRNAVDETGLAPPPPPSGNPAACPTSGSGPNGAPSYQDLLNTNTNGGCSILDIVFSDFTFLASQAGGAATVSASNVVYTLDSNTGSAGLIGFEFALALNASGAQSNDVKLSYSVRTASGAAKIASLHLLQTANTSGSGTATVTETYCFGGLSNTGCSQTDTLSTRNTLPHQDLLGLGPYSQLSIIEDINVAGNGAGGSAMISGVRNAIDETGLAPPPPTVGTPAACPATGSYQDLLNTNAVGGCFILDKVFSDFTLLASQAGGAATVSPASVVYTLDNDPSPSGLIGFEFALALSAAGVQSNEVELSYNVHTLSGVADITSLHLREAGSASGSGTATVTETYCLGGLNNTGCSQTGSLNTSLANPHQDLLGLGPYSQLSIITDIIATSDAAGDSASISGVRNAVDESSPLRPPLISKTFGAAAIPQNGTTSLSFTITNTNPTITVTNVAFSDTLPSGLVVSTPNGFMGSCGGGTMTATAGSNTISLMGATLAAGTSCTFSVNVTGTSSGVKNNMTMAVTSDQGTGNIAMASIIVAPADAFQARYISNLNVGDGIINITNTGSSGGVSTGNLCVNVYAFDPSEEMVACCSCLVTPNGLVSLSAQSDLIGNTLSPTTPSSLVVELLASSPTAGSCNPSSPNLVNLAPGVRAWSTTLHALPNTPASYGLTEGQFLESMPGIPAVSHLTTFCGFINANGSGFGICKSCRAGGLGGAKQ